MNNFKLKTEVRIAKLCYLNKYYVNNTPITFVQDLKNTNYVYVDVKDMIQFTKSDVLIPYLKIPPLKENELFEIRVVNTSKGNNLIEE